jgi:ankyrin repeat protein
MSTSAPSSNRPGPVAHNVAHQAGAPFPEAQIGAHTLPAVPVLVEAGDQRGMRAPLPMGVASDANADNVVMTQPRTVALDRGANPSVAEKGDTDEPPAVGGGMKRRQPEDGFTQSALPAKRPRNDPGTLDKRSIEDIRRDLARQLADWQYRGSLEEPDGPTNALVWLVDAHRCVAPHKMSGVDFNMKYTMIAALVRIGADVNAECADGGGAVLHTAAENQDLDMLKILVSMPGIDVNSFDWIDNTPLFYLRDRQMAAYDTLIGAGADIWEFMRRNVECNDEDGSYWMSDLLAPYFEQRKAQEADVDWYSMLYCAVNVPELAPVRSPASGGSSLQKLCFGSIHSDLLNGDYDAESMANVLAAVANTNFLMPLLHKLALAVVFGHYGLPQRPGQLDPIIRSTLESLGLLGHYSTLKNQIEASKNNVNRYLKNGMTLITQAACAGNSELIGLLLSTFGAALHWPDQHGNTAILAAAKSRQWNTCIALLSAGANPGTTTVAEGDDQSTMDIVAKAFAELDATADATDVESLTALIKTLCQQGYRFYQQPVRRIWLNSPQFRAEDAEGAEDASGAEGERMSLADLILTSKHVPDAAFREMVLGLNATIAATATIATEAAPLAEGTASALPANQPGLVAQPVVARPPALLTSAQVAAIFDSPNPVLTLTAWLANNPGNLFWTDENGQTLLHYAVNNFEVEIAALLLERGIDPAKTDSTGQTAKQLAQGMGSSAASALIRLLSD